MGARFDDDDGRLPVTVHGGAMKPRDLRLKMASAQVKTAIMLAATRADGYTEVHEPARSRDHTELMLPAYGVRVDVSPDRRSCRVEGVNTLQATDITVPGDPSSAVFWSVAGAIVLMSDVRVEGVSLNPTRTGFVRVLERMGLSVEVAQTGAAGYEPVGPDPRPWAAHLGSEEPPPRRSRAWSTLSPRLRRPPLWLTACRASRA